MESAPIRPILLAEDTPDDVFLLRRAFKRANLLNPLFVVQDGEEAINYLQGQGPFNDRERYPLPVLILLDVKMPRRTGFEVLQWVRQSMQSSIPVVMLTSSALESDQTLARNLGADSYLVKSSSFDDLVAMVSRLQQRWLIV